ncbi:MAG TPA: exosortase/archaeosortase family protein [Dehalococcoidia bacterium]|nr:exosortase/archaeosortase family protein [Dehalococcoidia bacterium]
MVKIKLIVWAVGCAVVALFFGELWGKLWEWLSPAGLQSHGVFHWGVLGLCILWLWLKRKDIWPRMQSSHFSLPHVLAGASLIALSILLPQSDDFLVFLMLVGWLGLFVIVFNRAWVIPSVLLAIYGFSVVFPIFAMTVIGGPSATVVAATVAFITGLFGIPVVSHGMTLQFTSLDGNVITTAITPGCVGYATIGVFIALFALMMLDIRLPLKKAWYMFLVGLAGTWLLNHIRLTLTIVAGYFWGLGGLDTVHYNINYVLFPLWYALFAYIYLRQTGWSVSAVRKDKPLE